MFKLHSILNSVMIGNISVCLYTVLLQLFMVFTVYKARVINEFTYRYCLLLWNFDNKKKCVYINGFIKLGHNHNLSMWVMYQTMYYIQWYIQMGFWGFDRNHLSEFNLAGRLRSIIFCCINYSSLTIPRMIKSNIHTQNKSLIIGRSHLFTW